MRFPASTKFPFGSLSVRPFLEVYSAYHPPGYYPLDCLFYPEWTRRMASYSPRCRWRPRLLRFGVVTRYSRPPVYLDDAIGSDDCLIHHVATLATFFTTLHPHNLKLSQDKSRAEAARIDVIGRVISAYSSMIAELALYHACRCLRI